MGLRILDRGVSPDWNGAVEPHCGEGILGGQLNGGHDLAAAGERTLEGRVNASGPTRLDQCSCEVVAGEGPMAGVCLGVGAWDVVEAQQVEGAIEANCACLGAHAEKRPKALGHLRGKVGEHVVLALRMPHRDLRAVEHAKGSTAEGVVSGRHRRWDIMIGECHGVEATRGTLLQHELWRVAAIGAGGVQVKVEPSLEGCTRGALLLCATAPASTHRAAGAS